MDIVLELLKNPKIQGLLISAVSNFAAAQLNSWSKAKLSEEVQFWIHPVYVVLSVIVAGLDAYQNGSLSITPDQVSNFLTIWTTAIIAHFAGNAASSSKATLKLKHSRSSGYNKVV